ncbi:hypothetical protein FSP39_020430 [Pinctada imbricata]|uniref:Uncharacterized protein n=1 Tax=Pinctada imbricata TaxID=66713 RepID=A0AA89BXR5_PINIB|nr:hypothetical protein FSP39_020430 [Pinctada imbricata]
MSSRRQSVAPPQNRRFSIFPDRRQSYDFENHGFEGEENLPKGLWRDGKIPINKAGLFSFLFMSWMSPLIWRMFRKRKENLAEEDIWRCSDLETCLPNTQRVTAIWEKELAGHGEKDASFLRVWFKFSLTRILVTLFFVAVNAVSTFLESGYLLNLIISYLEEPQYDLGYGITLVGCIAACQLVRATSFCLIIMLGIQTGIRFRAGYLGIAYEKLLRVKNMKGKALSEMVTLFGADAYRVYLNCVTFVYLLSLPVYLAIGITYTFILIGPWCFIAIGVFITCYLLQASLTSLVTKLREKTLVFTDKRVRKMTEVLNSMKLIKMYAWEKSFQDAIRAIRKLERKFLFIASLVNSIMTAVIPVTPTLATVATIAAYKGFGNEIKASTAFAVVGTLNFLRIIVAFIPFAIRMIGECRVSFKRMEKLLLMEEYKAPDRECEDPNNAVELEEATFIWNQADPINATPKKKKKDMKKIESKVSLQLNSLNLSVKKGKLIGICGSVGGGKSSLINAILGRMPMSTGRLAVDGTVAYAAQQAWIFNATVRENILFGKPYDPEWYQKVLSVCGLEPDMLILADGDETEIGDRGVNLSGGQKQRVSLARAVYSKSDIYLLDDVLSAVDVHVGRLLFHKCIRKTLEGKTVILVTHQLQYLKHCHEIMVIENGAIIERGNHDNLMSADGNYASLINKFHNENDPREQLAKAQNPKKDEADQGSTEQETANGDTNRDSVDTNRENDNTNKVNGDTNKVNGDTNTINGSVKTPEKIPEKGKLHKPATEKKAKGKLTSAEEVGIGDIKFGTYKSYINAAGGWCICSICLLTYIITFGCVVFSDWWLSKWIETFGGPMSMTVTNSTPAPSVVLANSGSVSPYQTVTSNPSVSTLLTTTMVGGDNTTTAEPTPQGLDMYLTVYISSIAFIIFATITRGLISAAVYIRASSRLHSRVLLNVMRAPMRFFDANPTGRILNRFSKDQDEADVFIPQFLDSFLQLACTILLSLVTAMISVPWIGLAILPVAIMYGIFKMVSTVSVRQFKRLENVARSPLLNHMTTSANGLGTIVTFNQQNQFMETNRQFTDTSSVATFLFDSSMRWIGLRLELTSAVIALATAFVLVLTKGSIDPATAGLAYTMCVRVVSIMQFSIRVMNEVEARFTSVERLHEYEKKLESESECFEITPPDSWPNEGRVIFTDVQMRYRDDMDPVLRNIRFDIHPRQKIGIVGRTGAGKSSLAAALFRLNELSGGHVYVDGIDVSKVSLHLLRSKLSTIPQDPVLFAGTMRYNLDPFDQYTDDDVWSALESVHMKDKVKQFDSQLEFHIEENGENFSVGERQLICLARAILRRNKILLLDEATANIDTSTDAKIQKTIKDSFADCTVLTIAHRLNTVLHCDQIIILDAGQVMETGSPQDLLSDPHSFFNSMMAAQTVKTPTST